MKAILEKYKYEQTSDVKRARKMDIFFECSTNACTIGCISITIYASTLSSCSFWFTNTSKEQIKAYILLPPNVLNWKVDQLRFFVNFNW